MRNSWPPPRKAWPLSRSSKLVGKRVMSKLRSLRTTLPVRPASELTPTPNSRLPVLVSWTLTITSLKGVSVSGWATHTRGPAFPSGGPPEPPRPRQVALRLPQGRVVEHLPRINPLQRVQDDV